MDEGKGRMMRLPAMALLAVILMLASVSPLAGEVDTIRADSSAAKDPDGIGLEIFGGRAKLAAMPIPGYNEAIGWSLGLAVSAFYRLNEADTISPESMTALFGLYAENGTWAGGAFQDLRFSEDRWRMQFGGAKADVSFQTFIGLPVMPDGGVFIDYTTSTIFGLAQCSRLVWKRLYLGAKYRYMKVDTEFHVDLPVDVDLKTRTFSGLGAVTTWDSRDNIFYPRSGYVVDLWALWNGSWIGSDQEYEIYYAEACAFRKIREGQVLGARLHSRVATGDVPFEDESIINFIDLRGYTDGRYRADQRHTVQAEYRWSFYRRFSAAGFGGFGWSVDELSDISWDGILPSIGCGVRWMMITDPPVNIGVDLAWGKDDNAFYFRIGESF